MFPTGPRPFSHFITDPMSPLPKPDIIFTHESDLDGFVSGCLLQRLAKSLFDVDIAVEPLSSSPWNNLKRYPKRAWVCDLSFDPKTDREDWVIIDHHMTEHQPTKATLIHDLNLSASKLCYNILKENKAGNATLERLVELTNIADLYLCDHPDFELATDYARLVKTYHFRPLHRLIGNQLETLIDHPLLELMELKRRVEDPIGLTWSKDHITEITSDIAYVATAIGDTNYIVHQILEEATQPYKALITFFKKPSGPVTASIRSQNGEALEVARSLQGGGHPNAAGTTLPRSVTTFEGAVDYLRQVLSPAKPTPEEIKPGTEALFDSAGF